MATSPIPVVNTPAGVPTGPIPVVNTPQGVPSGPLPVTSAPAGVPATLPVVNQPASIPQIAPQVQQQPQNVPQVTGVTTANGQPIQTPSNLTEAQKQKLDGIVQQMIADGQPQQTIQAVVNDFKQKYGNTPTPDNVGKSTTENLGIGALKGVGSTVHDSTAALGSLLNPVANWITKVLGGNPDNAASQFEQQANQNLANLSTPNGVAQHIGFGAEQVGEMLAAPDAALEEGAADAGGKFFTKQLGQKVAQEAVSNAAFQKLHGSTNTGLDLALGAAGPIVGKGLSTLWSKVPQVFSNATGVSQDVIKQATENPDLWQQSMKEVADNPSSPYNPLASQVSQAMISGEKDVKAAYKQGLAQVTEAAGDTTFNVSPQISQVNDVLKNFNLSTELVRNPDGTLSDTLAIKRTPQVQLSEAELGKLDNLVNSVRQSKAISFQDLTQLQQKFDNAYNEIPYGANNSPTTYHAIVSQLGDVLDKKVATVAKDYVPQMAAVNKQYAEYKQILKQFGNKFIDRTDTANPQQAPQAEGFLSNLLNKNKLQQQVNVKKLEEFTGIPILDRVAGLKAAQQFQKVVESGKPNTIQKFMTNAGLGGGALIGGSLHGIPGAAGGAEIGYQSGKVLGKLASPTSTLKAVTVADKVADKIPTAAKQATKGLSQRLANRAPGAVSLGIRSLSR